MKKINIVEAAVVASLPVAGLAVKGSLVGKAQEFAAEQIAAQSADTAITLDAVIRDVSAQLGVPVSEQANGAVQQFAHNAAVLRDEAQALAGTKLEVQEGISKQAVADAFDVVGEGTGFVLQGTREAGRLVDDVTGGTLTNLVDGVSSLFGTPKTSELSGAVDEFSRDAGGSVVDGAKRVVSAVQNATNYLDTALTGQELPLNADLVGILDKLGKLVRIKNRDELPRLQTELEGLYGKLVSAANELTTTKSVFEKHGQAIIDRLAAAKDLPAEISNYVNLVIADSADAAMYGVGALVATYFVVRAVSAKGYNKSAAAVGLAAALTMGAVANSKVTGAVASVQQKYESLLTLLEDGLQTDLTQLKTATWLSKDTVYQAAMQAADVKQAAVAAGVDEAAKTAAQKGYDLLHSGVEQLRDGMEQIVAQKAQVAAQVGELMNAVDFDALQQAYAGPVGEAVALATLVTAGTAMVMSYLGRRSKEVTFENTYF